MTAIKMEHYFTSKPASTAHKKTIEYFYKQKFCFFTASSVFSKDKVDTGTDILIRNCKIKSEDAILDLGCGYGPVGTVIGKFCPSCKITMTDINERALALAKENLQASGVVADVIKSFLYEEIHKQFDVILSNPPQSAGKETCMRIIMESPGYLKENGSLQVVARHNRGGKEFKKKMEEVFGNCETLARESGYHVYIAVKKS